MTCLLVHSSVDFNLHIPANALLLAFVFGVLANPGRSLDPGSTAVPPRGCGWTDWLPRLALPALGIWMAVAGLPRLPGEYYCEKARIALRDGHNAPCGELDYARQGLRANTRNGIPSLYFYLGQARQSLAGNGPDSPRGAVVPQGGGGGLPPGAAPRADGRLPRSCMAGEMLTRLGDYRRPRKSFRTGCTGTRARGYADTYYGILPADHAACCRSGGGLRAGAVQLYARVARRATGGTRTLSNAPPTHASD